MCDHVWEIIAVLPTAQHMRWCQRCGAVDCPAWQVQTRTPIRDDLSADVTILIPVGPGPYNTLAIVDLVLDNLRTHFGDRAAMVFIFDALPSFEEIARMPELLRRKWWDVWRQASRGGYERFRQEVISRHSSSTVRIVDQPRCGLQSGALKLAMPDVTTDFVFVTQPDCLLLPNADVATVLHLMMAHDAAKYVAFEKHCCFSHLARMWFRIRDRENLALCLRRGRCAITAMDGYTDQSHLARTAWYRSVLEQVPARNSCECVLNESWKAYQPGGTFLRGVHGEGPYSLHLPTSVQPPWKP